MIHIPDNIAGVYQARRREREDLLEKLWEEHLERTPELRDIERNRQLSNIRLIQFRLKDRLDGVEESPQTRALKAELRELNRRVEDERAQLFAKHEFYHCALCQDTGEYEGKLCRCAETILLMLEQRAGVSFPPPEEKNFERFDLNLFPGEKSPEWYGGKLSPREVMRRWQEKLLSFCEEFPASPIHLYLFGTTGTGKTYLAASAANRLRQKGFRVVFLSVHHYLRMTRRLRVLEASFNPEREELQRAREEVRAAESADCLILDDLGTETLREEQYNDLIELLNRRENNPRSSMILTGNMELFEFSRKYDERIGSRLMGRFVQARLEGPDLRLCEARKRREQLR